MNVADPVSLGLIQKIEVVWGRVPVSVRFSYGTQATFPFSLVCVFSRGQVGLGETLTHPTPLVLDLARGLLGREAGELDHLVDEYFPAQENVEKEAFSIALHDLVSKLQGRSLSEHLGPVARTRVPLMPCLFPNEPRDVHGLMEKYLSLGFTHLKTKLLGQLEHDVEVVRGIRQVAGAGIYLQGDANNGYPNLAAAREALPRLKEAGLDVIEDAVEAEVEDLRSLRSPDHPALMADMPARSRENVVALCKAEAVDYINLHPCQQGTLSEALARAEVARAHGVRVVVGGTGFCGAGTAAYQHLAGVIGLDGPCGELGGAFDHGMPQGLMKRSIARDNGCAVLTAEPGHGAEPDWERLEEFVAGRAILE